ncbi:MAG: STM3941 family protein [Janthinobacterium lividum]
MKIPQFYYYSKSFLILAIFMMLAIVAASSWMLYLILRLGSEAFYSWFGWIFTLFFGWMLAWTLVLVVRFFLKLISNTPRLMLTNSGITDYGQKIGEICWMDIEDAYLRSNGKALFICLVLCNPDKYLVLLSPYYRFLARFNKGLGFTPIGFNISSVKADTNELLATIKLLAAQNRQPA